MQLLWTESLTAGMVDFDGSDHAKLIELTDCLRHAIEAAGAREEIGALLDRLQIQTRLHCETEQLRYFQTGYPRQDSGRREHLELAGRLEEMIERFHSSTNPEEAMEIAESIYDRVAGHIYTPGTAAYMPAKKHSFRFHARQIV